MCLVLSLLSSRLFIVSDGRKTISIANEMPLLCYRLRSNSYPQSHICLHSLPSLPSIPFPSGELIERDEASSGAVRYHLLDLQGVDRSQHSHMLVQQLLSLAVHGQPHMLDGPLCARRVPLPHTH